MEQEVSMPVIWTIYKIVSYTVPLEQQDMDIMNLHQQELDPSGRLFSSRPDCFMQDS